MQTEARVTRSRAKALNTPLTAPLPYGGQNKKSDKEQNDGEELPRKALFELPNTPATRVDTSKDGPQPSKAIKHESGREEKENAYQITAQKIPGKSTQRPSSPARLDKDQDSKVSSEQEIQGAQTPVAPDRSMTQCPETEILPLPLDQAQPTILQTPAIQQTDKFEAAPSTLIMENFERKVATPCSVAPPQLWGFLQPGQSKAQTPMPTPDAGKVSVGADSIGKNGAFGSPILAQDTPNKSPQIQGESLKASTPVKLTPISFTTGIDSASPLSNTSDQGGSLQEVNPVEKALESGNFKTNSEVPDLETVELPQLLPGDLSRIEALVLNNLPSSSPCSIVAEAGSETSLQDRLLMQDLSPSKSEKSSSSTHEKIGANADSQANLTLNFPSGQVQTSETNTKAPSKEDSGIEAPFWPKSEDTSLTVQEGIGRLGNKEAEDTKMEDAEDTDAAVAKKHTEPAFQKRVAKLDALHEKKGGPDLDRWELDGEALPENLQHSVSNSEHQVEKTVKSGVDVSSYDPRSLRQLKKEVKSAYQSKPKLPGLKGSPTNSSTSSLYSDVHKVKGNKQEEEEVTSLAQAIGGMKIASQSPEPLKGVPVPEGKHTRFDEEGNPSNVQDRVVLRGVPKARGTHIRFD